MIPSDAARPADGGRTGPSEESVGTPYLSEEQIRSRVGELGAEIADDYRDGDLVLLSILKGAVIFLTDLARAIPLPLELDFLALTSYEDERKREETRPVRLLKDVEFPLEGRDVLIVEDIIDTGLTLHYITRNLSLRSPRSLEICTLLDRPYRRLADIPVRYRGFTVPDDFFVGYGFDRRQLYRNLPYLAHLHV